MKLARNVVILQKRAYIILTSAQKIIINPCARLTITRMVQEMTSQKTTYRKRHHTLGVIRCGFENLPKSCWFDASKTAESPPQSHVTCRNSIHLPNIHHRPKHSYCISQQACWVNHLGRAAGKRHDKYATITRADHQHYTCLIEQLR